MASGQVKETCLGFLTFGSQVWLNNLTSQISKLQNHSYQGILTIYVLGDSETDLNA